MDNGASWTGVTLVGMTIDGSTIPGLVWLAVDPVLTNHIYLGSTGSNSVYRSADFGDTWNGSNLTLNVSMSGLSVDPSNPGVVFASVGSFIYKSADFGTTWTQLANKFNLGSTVTGYSAGSVIVDPRNSNVLYVGNSGVAGGLCSVNGGEHLCGLFRSVDGGATWSNVGPPGAYGEVVFDARTDDLYIGANVTGVGGATLKSSDGGDTWTPVSRMVEPRLTADPGTASHILAVQATSIDSVFSSSNGGVNWTSVRLLNQAHSSVVSYVSGLAVPKALGNVSAASFRSGPLSPESIATAIGFDLAAGALAATTSPPPLTLGGATITITDSLGVSRQAPLFFVAPGQINYEIPAGTATGTATVTVINREGASSTARLQIDSVAPALFALNTAGLAAALVLRVSANGSQSYEDVYQLDATKQVQAHPIDLGNGDTLYLLLYGTGVRGGKGSETSVTIGGVPATVLYVGPQGQFDGEDQVNIVIPSGLTGRGATPLVLTTAGHVSNTVNLTFK
jgi:uncharacterized protein (TIGR03437 family)